MKTIKVSEATKIQLDWLVARALGYATKVRNWRDITSALDPIEDADIIAFHKERNTIRVSAEQFPGYGWFPNKEYTTDWSQMGPIIEREEIRIDPPRSVALWSAEKNGHLCHGTTPLTAAARCYVVSKLGEEVEVPEELA